MKILNKTNSKSKIIGITLVVLIVVAGAYTALAYSNNWFPFTKEQPAKNVNTVDLEPPTDEQVQTGKDIKDESIEAENAKPPTGTVDVSITAANQNGSSLQVRTLIQATTNTGTCTLTLSNQGTKTVTKTAGLQAQSSTSTCAGFDVPVSELSSGTWNILVSFENSTINGKASSTVEIK
jgi:hypothetical protein